MESKTPTLEEVKEYFKNAKEIITPIGGQSWLIDVLKYGVYYDDENTIRQKIDDNNSRILLYYKGEYSKIISYKEEIDFIDGKEIETPKHYDNSKGSIYQFCENQKLNAWESDLIKRIVRCRKKGEFRQDLEKTKHLIDLYLKEYDN